MRRIQNCRTLLQHFFSTKTSIDIPVPDVLHIDESHDSAGGSLHVTQGSLLGRALDKVCKLSNHPQRLDVARQVGEVMTKITASQFPAVSTVDPKMITKILAMTEPNSDRNKTELAKADVHRARSRITGRERNRPIAVSWTDGAEHAGCDLCGVRLLFHTRRFLLPDHSG